MHCPDCGELGTPNHHDPFGRWDCQACEKQYYPGPIDTDQMRDELTALDGQLLHTIDWGHVLHLFRRVLAELDQTRAELREEQAEAARHAEMRAEARREAQYHPLYPERA